MDNTILDGLTEAQQRELYVKLANVYGRPNSKAVIWTEDETDVWDTVCEYIGTRRVLGDALTSAGSGYTRQRYADDVAGVIGWINRGCGREINRTQRLALLATGVECLARQIGRDHLVSHTQMLQQLAKLPWALDRAFPGYRDARILDRVVPLAA